MNALGRWCCREAVFGDELTGDWGVFEAASLLFGVTLLLVLWPLCPHCLTVERVRAACPALPLKVKCAEPLSLLFILLL